MDSDRLYKLMRPWVEFATRCHYASVSVRGVEHLPREGGYIMAPCHQNGMMEPLLLLLLTPAPVYHICRGDIFANPIIARALHFLKILPIYRRRDGLKAVKQNEHTFELSQRVLLDGYALSMMAEGRHNDRHQLLPLVKGMFRIALQTQQAMGDKPLYIVPIGIDLDYYERPYSHAVLNIGEPIDTRSFLSAGGADDPQTLNLMRDVLTRRLQGVMHHIGSSAHYGEHYDLCWLLNQQERRRLGIGDGAYDRFVARCSVAQRMDVLEQQAAADPASHEAAEYGRLTDYAVQRRRYADKHHRTIERLGEAPTLWQRMQRYGAIAVAAGLLAWGPTRSALLFVLLCNPVPWVPTHLAVRHMVEDSQFRSSINFAVRLLLTVVYLVTLFVVLAATRGVIWAIAGATLGIVIARIAAPVADWLRRGL